MSTLTGSEKSVKAIPTTEGGTWTAIPHGIWDLPWFRRLSPEAQFAWIYLSTSKGLTTAGMAKVSAEFFEDETRRPGEEFERGRDELVRSGIVVREGSWVWIKDNFKDKPGARSPNMLKSVAYAIAGVPDALRRAFMEHYAFDPAAAFSPVAPKAAKQKRSPNGRRDRGSEGMPDAIRDGIGHDITHQVEVEEQELVKGQGQTTPFRLVHANGNTQGLRPRTPTPAGVAVVSRTRWPFDLTDEEIALSNQRREVVDIRENHYLLGVPPEEQAEWWADVAYGTDRWRAVIDNARRAHGLDPKAEDEYQDAVTTVEGPTDDYWDWSDCLHGKVQCGKPVTTDALEAVIARAAKKWAGHVREVLGRSGGKVRTAPETDGVKSQASAPVDRPKQDGVGAITDAQRTLIISSAKAAGLRPAALREILQEVAGVDKIADLPGEEFTKVLGRLTGGNGNGQEAPVA